MICRLYKRGIVPQNLANGMIIAETGDSHAVGGRQVRKGRGEDNYSMFRVDICFTYDVPEKAATVCSMIVQKSLSDGSLGDACAFSRKGAKRLFTARGMVISASTRLGGGR